MLEHDLWCCFACDVPGPIALKCQCATLVAIQVGHRHATLQLLARHHISQLQRHSQGRHNVHVFSTRKLVHLACWTWNDNIYTDSEVNQEPHESHPHPHIHPLRETSSLRRKKRRLISPQDLKDGPFFSDMHVFGIPVPLSDNTTQQDAYTFAEDCGDGGCLFNVEVDPTEHNDLSQDPAYANQFFKMQMKYGP